MNTILRFAILVTVLSAFDHTPSATAADEPFPEIASLRKALTFYASFNSGTTADVADGDPQIYTAQTLGERASGRPGLPNSGAVKIAKDAGRFGDALQFGKPGPEIVFYKVDRQLAYTESDWSAAVSIWLKLDPDKDLAPGYVDPLFITPRTYNDGALWIDFTDQAPRQFRHGAVPDRKVWDPDLRGFEQTPAGELPLVVATKPPFSAESWTHVVISFENFNTGRPDGVSTLYLNGEPAGSVRAREQTYSWDVQQATACLGISYTGLIDELAFFDRSLTATEIAALYHSSRPLFETREVPADR